MPRDGCVFLYGQGRKDETAPRSLIPDRTEYSLYVLPGSIEAALYSTAEMRQMPFSRVFVDKP
jgi:hypothetical protein